MLMHVLEATANLWLMRRGSAISHHSGLGTGISGQCPGPIIVRQMSSVPSGPCLIPRATDLSLRLNGHFPDGSGLVGSYWS